MNTDTTLPNSEKTANDDSKKVVKANRNRTFSEIRQLFFDALTDDDITDMARKLIEVAKEGNFNAIKLVLEYTIGKPEVLWKSLESTLGSGEPAQAANRPPHRFSASSLPPLSASDLLPPGRSLPSTGGFGDASDIQLVPNRNARRDEKRKGR